jgi:cytoskeletal protein CcmA (bactofilin family)
LPAQRWRSRPSGRPPEPFLKSEEQLRAKIITEARRRLEIAPDDVSDEALRAIEDELDAEAEAVAEPVDEEAALARTAALVTRATQPGAPGAIAGTSGAAEATAGASAPYADADRYGKRLIVGEGIRLSGEISSCDRLVIQGEVEVVLNDTLALEIARSGRFTGGCEVEEADISGIYEGDLKVRKRLRVRATGWLNGTIRYAQLELERGGQIAGNVSVISADGASSKTGAARVLDWVTATFRRQRSESLGERSPSAAEEESATENAGEPENTSKRGR